MIDGKKLISRRPVFGLLGLVLAIVGLSLAGCSEDLPTQAPASSSDQVTGVFHVDLPGGDADFEIVSTKNGDPTDPIHGPFAIRGRNIRYDTDLNALIMDLSVANLGDDTFDEPVTLTFLSLLPDGVTVLNPDNGENGLGAAITFEFDNDDGQWTPGEESLGRETQFGVDQGISIGFVARLDVGSGGDDLGSIGGIVWNDENGDGIMGELEGGVEGAMLKLSAEGMETTTTMSGADGTYRFDGLASGFYQVTKTPMDDMVSTTSTMIYVILVSEDGTVSSFLAANFGCRHDDGNLTMISGVVFEDLNGDGIQDMDEPGMSGVTVTLAGAAMGVSVTGTDGSYMFGDLDAGEYTVATDAMDGYTSTTGLLFDVTLVEGDIRDDVDFGFMAKAGGNAVIGGVVFNDMNGNKIRDEGEPGLEGITVDLSGAATATTMSDATGLYTFTGLSIGQYDVTSTGPFGWQATTGPVLSIKLEAENEVVSNAHLGWMEVPVN